MKHLLLLILSLSCAAVAAEENPDIELQDLQGKTHKLSDYQGKWVVVNYWATWCPPCLEEIPDLVDFHAQHKDHDAVVLGINYEDIGVEQLRDFSESLFINYPVLDGDANPQSPLGMIIGLPTTFLVSPEGEAVARQNGPITAKAINAFIERKKKAGAVTTVSGKAQE